MNATGGRGHPPGQALPTTFGREQEMATVLGLLGRERLVTLTGRAGVGKTHLARDVVAQWSPGRTIEVSLASVARADMVLPAIATALGLTLLPSDDAPRAVSLALADDPSPLLHLDNFEHVLDAASEIGSQLGQVPQLRVLVTSQTPLRLDGERVVTLDPLPLPDPDLAPETLSAQPAVALYCHRAWAADPRFRLDEHNARAVADLCHTLEGLPLALELAAARTAVLPAPEILRRLQAEPLGLLSRRGGASSRHQDLRSAIRWTFDQHGAGEQRLLLRLSLIPATFGLDEVEALGTDAEAIDELSALVDFRLVDSADTSDPPRFSMPTSIRSFAAEELSARGQRDEAAAAFIDWAVSHSRHLVGENPEADAVATMQAICRATESLHAAAELALACGRPADAVEILLPVARRWTHAGHHPTQERLLTTTLEAAEAVRTPARSRLTAYLGLLVFHTSDAGRTEEISARLNEAEALARDLGDPVSQLEAMSARALTSPLTGDFAGAIQAAHQGLVIAAEAALDGWLARFELIASSLARMGGDFERGIELALSALDRSRRSGYLQGVVAAGAVLRPMVDAHPELDETAPRTADTIALAARLEMVWYHRALLPVLAQEAMDTGDLDLARERLAEAIKSVRGSHSPTLTGFTMIAAVHLAEALAEPALAITLDAAIESYRTTVLANSPPERAAQHARAMDRARGLLGAEEVAGAVRRGHLLGLDRAMELAATRLAPQPATTTETSLLTPRQSEVLRLLARGLRNDEIAEALWLSPKTVMHHTGAIYRALGVRGRSEATAWALRHGQD